MCLCLPLLFIFYSFASLLHLVKQYCALCMTVISSVYKDDNVKCHSSPGGFTKERLSPFCSTFVVYHTFQSHGAFVLFFFCFNILSVCSKMFSFYHPVSHLYNRTYSTCCKKENNHRLIVMTTLKIYFISKPERN